MSSSPSGGPRRRSHNSPGNAPSRADKATKPNAKGYTGRRAATGSQPPRWLMVMLTGCVVFLVAIAISRLTPRPAAYAQPAPTVTPTTASAPTPTVTPTAAPTPTPTPEFTVTPTAAPDYAQPVPATDSADPDTWFQDALFIGNSRVDGLRLYSGIKGADFLTHVGLSVYQVMDGDPVIRRGEDMISVLEAVGQKEYNKIYVALGINELGYFRAQGFADTMGELVDELRALQPQATLYIQAILPVNTALCQKYEQRYYITNEAIDDYNAALAGMTEEKEVWLLDIPDQLLDQNGEIKEELSADGVHMQRAGYVIWLDYLLSHTGEGEAIPQDPASTPTMTPTLTPAVTPAPTPMPTRQPQPTAAPTPEPTVAPTAAPAPTEQEEAPPLIIGPMGPTQPAEPSPQITEQEDGET